MVDHLFSCRIPGTSRGKKKKRSQLYYCYPSDRAKEESWIIESMLKQKGARRLAGCFGSLHFTWASGGLLSGPCRLWQKAWAQNYPEARQKDFHECQGVPAQPWHCRTRESLMGPQFSKRLSTSSKHFDCRKPAGVFPSKHNWRWARSKVFRQFSTRNKGRTEAENNTHLVLFETVSASVNFLGNQCLIVAIKKQRINWKTKLRPERINILLNIRENK